MTDALSAPSAHAATFLLIWMALCLKSTGAKTTPAQPADVEILVLTPALQAAQTLAHGFEMSHRVLRDSHALAGLAGASAQREFGETFDYAASEATTRGDFDVEVPPPGVRWGCSCPY